MNQWFHYETIKIQPIAKGVRLALTRQHKEHRGGYLSRLAILLDGQVSTRAQARKVAAQLEALLTSEDP